jgi:threonylcarbamoyladenosine tRNA methylthiotransferase MtaB
MKYAVVTFGCRVNQADSLAIESELARAGAEAASADRADVVIVNTCSVTASADQGARQTIRRIARENPAARIVATGCYATRCAGEVGALPGVVEIVPNQPKETRQWLRLIQRQEPAADGPCGRPLSPGLMGRTAWTLRVQTGCEEACSYCIIPSTRGASRSRGVADVAAEVDRVAAAGYKEIVITGVHLGSYGRDLQPRSSLIELMSSLSLLAGDSVLFRISSLEPMDFPRKLLDLPVAPHFHLPLQHASDRILEAMRRPYTIEYYAGLTDDIRRRLPHASIGSDVIAGFPGETDDDFAELCAYLERSPLTHLHVFPYSDRPGTGASALDGKVPGSVVRARAQRLREISRVLQQCFREAQCGTIRRALTIDDGSMAVSDNYVRVAAPPGHGRNEWVRVTL